jgi:hypothetical protein
MFWMTSGVALLIVGAIAVLIAVAKRPVRLRELGSVSRNWINAHSTDVARESK